MLRVHVPRTSSRQQREKIEVERVALVVRRPLDVPAVRRESAIDLVQKDSPAVVDPALARREFRKCLPDDIERQRLARQMGIRAEVVREVLFDVRELALERDRAATDR